MSKVKRKELVEKANDHELRLFQIEKALEQHGINWFSDEPKLKQLDQSVFDGLDSEWRFAAVDGDGRAHRFTSKVEPHSSGEFMSNDLDCGFTYELIGTDYDTTDWQNSLIERDKVELTGSDLCRVMLERGDKIVTCAVSDISDDNALGTKVYDAITSHKENRTCPFESSGDIYICAVPVNNQGEPLTASEVGL